MRAKIRKFILGLGNYVKKECKVTLMILSMDISRLMVYAQQLEKDNKRDMEDHLRKMAKLLGPESNQPK